MIFFKRKKKPLGERGEKIAEKYLKRKGYKILSRNFANNSGRRIGEIDIIAKEGKEIVFVEVKTRAMESSRSILPEESITPAKLHKLNKISTVYIDDKKLWDLPYRFDGISVWISGEKKKPEIKHIRNIFI